MVETPAPPTFPTTYTTATSTKRSSGSSFSTSRNSQLLTNATGAKSSPSPPPFTTSSRLPTITTPRNSTTSVAASNAAVASRSSLSAATYTTATSTKRSSGSSFSTSRNSQLLTNATGAKSSPSPPPFTTSSRLPTITTPRNSTTSVAASNAAVASQSLLSAGSVAGIVIGSIVFVTIVVLLLVWLLYSSKYSQIEDLLVSTLNITAGFSRCSLKFLSHQKLKSFQSNKTASEHGFATQPSSPLSSNVVYENVYAVMSNRYGVTNTAMETALRQHESVASRTSCCYVDFSAPVYANTESLPIEYEFDQPEQTPFTRPESILYVELPNNYVGAGSYMYGVQQPMAENNRQQETFNQHATSLTSSYELAGVYCETSNTSIRKSSSIISLHPYNNVDPQSDCTKDHVVLPVAEFQQVMRGEDVYQNING